MPEGLPKSSAEPTTHQRNEWWVSNNSNGSIYPLNNDFIEESKDEPEMSSEGFVKALRLALDGKSTALNGLPSTKRMTPSVAEDKLEFVPHHSAPRIPDLNREDKARVMKLVSELTQSQQDRSELRIKVEKMKRHNAVVIAEMNNYKLKLSQTVSQLKSCNDKIESLKVEREEAREQLRRVQIVTSEVAETFTKERSVMQRERQALLNRYSTKEREVMQLRARCENLKQALLRQKGIDMYQKGLAEPLRLSYEFPGTGRGGGAAAAMTEEEEEESNNTTERRDHEHSNYVVKKSPLFVDQESQEIHITHSLQTTNMEKAVVDTERGGGESVESSISRAEEDSYREKWRTKSVVKPLREQAKRFSTVKSQELQIQDVTINNNNSYQPDPKLSLIQLVDELDASAE